MRDAAAAAAEDPPHSPASVRVNDQREIGTTGTVCVERYLCGVVRQGLLCGRLRADGVGQGGAPAAQRGRTILTIPRAGADFLWAGRRRRGGSLRYLGARRTWCRRRQQSGSGVPRKRRARSRQCYMAVQPGSWRARSWQEQTAVATRDVRMGDRDRRDQRCSGRHRVDDVGIEVAQDVIAASGELAGN